MKKLLLTGASGFVGKSLQNRLKRDYEVIGVGTKDCDLRSQSACELLVDGINPDIIVHAAGTVGGILANKENPGKFMHDNLAMGINIIDKARRVGVDKFILLSTVCAYPKFATVPFKEEELWGGYPEETNAPYGIAKKTLMKLIETYQEQYGFKGVNLIPVNMYGPYDHFNLTTSHVIPALILKVKNAIDSGADSISLWGTGQASREFLFVSDCAEAVACAIERNPSSSPINIGTGREVKICELVEIIAEVMRFSGSLVYDSTKPDGQPRRCLDTAKAKDELGFEAKISLREGVRQTVDWFLDSIAR